MHVRTNPARARARRFAAIAIVFGLLGTVLPAVTASAVEADTIYAELDLQRPELAEVAAAVAASDYTAAADALQEHYATRTAPQFSPVTPGSRGSLVASTPDELIAGQFRFPDGQQRDFSGGIDWSDPWSEDPSILGSPYYLIYDFAFYPTLSGQYLALDPSDPKRAELAAAWMRIAKDFIAAHVGVEGAYNRLGAAKRLTQWLTAYSVFKSDPTISAADHADYLTHLYEMTDDLWANIESYNGNNWYISIGRAIYLSAVYFPEFSASAAWEMRARGVADRFINRHIKGDGNEYEPALNYQAYSLSLLLQIEEFGRLNGRSPLAEHLPLLEKQAEALMDATMPNFRVPLIGDTSSGSIPLGNYADIFDRDDMRWVASSGTQGTQPQSGSTLYPHSFGIMRTGWGADSSYLFINNQDTDYGSSHRHPDDLSIVAYAHGRPLLVDPGVIDYNDTPDSNWLRRTTEAHNTVEVNGAPQPAVGTLPRLRAQTQWLSNEGFDFYSGTHDDYAPIMHDRSIFFAKPGLWVVSDRLHGGSGENAYRQLWHVPADAAVTVTDAGVVNTGFGAVPGIALVSVDDSVQAQVHHDGIVTDGEGAITKDVDYLSFDQTVSGSASFDTVLVPGPAGAPVSVAAQRIPLTVGTDVASALAIELADSESVYYLSSEQTPQPRAVGDYQVDGGLFYAERSGSGKLTSLSLGTLRSLDSNGVSLVESSEQVAELSIEYGENLELTTSTPFTAPVRIHAPEATEVLLNGEPTAFTRDGDIIVLPASGFAATGPALFQPQADPDELETHQWAFSGGDPAEWTPTRGSWAPTETAAGVWGMHQSDVAAIEAAIVRDASYADTDFAANFTLEGASPTFGVGLYLRYQDSLNYYLMRLYRTGGQLSAQIIRVSEGTTTVLASQPVTTSLSGQLALRAVAEGQDLSFWAGGQQLVATSDAALASGGVGLYAHRASGTFGEVMVDANTNRSWDFANGGADEWTANRGTWAAAERVPGIWGFQQQNAASRDSDAYIAEASADTTLSTNFSVTAAQATMAFGMYLRYQGPGNYYILRLYRTGGQYTAQILRISAGSSSTLASVPITVSLADPLALKGVAVGNRIEFWLDGELLVSAEDSTFATGGIGLYADRVSGYFEDITNATGNLEKAWNFAPNNVADWWLVKGQWAGDDGPIPSGRLRQFDASGSDSAAIFVDAPRDVQLSGDFTLEGGAATFAAGMYLRYHDAGNMYLLRLYRSGGVISAQILRLIAGKPTVLASEPITIDVSQQVSMRALASGNKLELWLNGDRVATATDNELPTGAAGLHLHRAAGSFESLKMSELVDGDVWRTENGVAVTGENAMILHGDSAQLRSKDGISWTDYSARASVTPEGWADGSSVGLVLRTSGNKMGYRLLLQEVAGVKSARIERLVTGSRGTQAPILLAETPVVFDPASSIDLEGVARGNLLEFIVNGQRALRVHDGVITRGGVALHTSGATATFESVVVTAPGDVTAPVTRASVNSPSGEQAGWHSAPAVVELTASDSSWASGTGVALTEYRVNDAPWTAYSSPLSMSDGIHRVDYRSTDGQGNVEQVQSLTVRIDTSAPETQLSLGGGNPAVAVATATDAHSGVQLTEYRLGGGEWTPLVGVIEIPRLEAAQLVEYRSVDVAGNVEPTGSAHVDAHDPIESIPDRLKVSLDRLTEAPGGPLGLAISGAAPETTYRVKLHSDPVLLGLLVTDASGKARGSFTVQPVAPGSHKIVVSDVFGSVVAQVPLRPPAWYWVSPPAARVVVTEQ